MSRRRILVTGATRGIGRAIADELASDTDLLVGGRDARAVEEVCRALPSAQPFVAELTDEDEVTEAVRGIDRLDGVVHSAGVLGSGTLEQVHREDWQRTFDVNVVAVAELTRLLIPQLREAKGEVVLINSGSGYTAHAASSRYCASKFALRAFADSIRQEEAEHGVRVSSVYPGRVDTDMQQDLVDYLGKEYNVDEYLKPTTVARAVRFVLDVPDDACVQDLTVRPFQR